MRNGQARERSSGGRRRGAAALAVTMAAALAACGSSGPDRTGKPDASGLVRIRVAGADGISSATPLFVAQRQGYFKQAGLDVSYVNMSSGAAAMAAAMRAGEIDVGLGGATQWISDTARGAIKGKLIGEFTDNVYVILARKGIADPHQLSGKIFAMSNRNGGDYIYTQAVLSHLGVKADNVTWLQMGDPAARLGALIAGRVDATSMSLTSLPESARERMLIGIDQSPIPFVSSAIYVRQPLLDANKGAMTKFLAAIGKASDWARQHPAEAMPACLETGSSESVCRTTLKVALGLNSQYTWSPTTRVNTPAIAAMLPVVGAVVPQVKTLKLADIVDDTVAPSGSNGK